MFSPVPAEFIVLAVQVGAIQKVAECVGLDPGKDR